MSAYSLFNQKTGKYIKKANSNQVRRKKKCQKKKIMFITELNNSVFR